MWGRQWMLMEQASDGAGAASAGGGTGTAVAAAAVAGGGASGGAGTNGAQPAGGNAAQGAQAGAASALAQGAGEAASAGGGHWLPEKYHVKDDAGALKLEESAKKLAEGYTALAKRLGTGDTPPETEDGYKVDKLPDGVPTWDEIKADPAMKGFIKGAHARGITNAQLEYVIGEHYKNASELVAGAKELDESACKEALGKVWAEPAALQQNLGHAYRATAAAAAKAGFQMDEVYAALGNNPMFVRLMAALGPEFKEGSVPTVNGAGSGAQTVEQLMQSEAYWNDKHPDHKRVSEAVRAHYSQKFGNGPAR